MSIILDPAKNFFEACETGKGWDACKAYCNSDATFSSQTGALSDISTVEDYCEWMKNLLTPIPDGHYELKFLAADALGAAIVQLAANGTAILATCAGLIILAQHVLPNAQRGLGLLDITVHRNGYGNFPFAVWVTNDGDFRRF